MKSPGHVAYDAYRAHTGGVSIITGDMLPDFADLDWRIRAAWEAAANAVMGET